MRIKRNKTRVKPLSQFYLWYWFLVHLCVLAVLDIILGWKARRSMSSPVKLRYVLKFAFACIWVIILPITYAYMWETPNGISKTIRSWFGNGGSQPSLYLVAVIIYETPDVLAFLLFLLPCLRRFLERSNYRIVRLLMWWSQVLRCFYVTLPGIIQTVVLLYWWTI